jgi:hypothetical protein
MNYYLARYFKVCNGLVLVYVPVYYGRVMLPVCSILCTNFMCWRVSQEAKLDLLIDAIFNHVLKLLWGRRRWLVDLTQSPLRAFQVGGQSSIRVIRPFISNELHFFFFFVCYCNCATSHYHISRSRYDTLSFKKYNFWSSLSM